ncbi:MAG: FAD-binding protein, partial [Betaproteobacteria bacterium]
MLGLQEALSSTDKRAKALRQRQIVDTLSGLVPKHALLFTPEDTTPYECDGLTAYRQKPVCVVLPETEDQVQAVLSTCHAHGFPVVARGAGTGLS